MLSDIGGAAGLFLGISVGTIMGVLDFLIIAMLNSIKKMFKNHQKDDFIPLRLINFYIDCINVI